MSLSLVPIYAAVLAVLYVALSIRIILLRERHQVALGDGGQPELLRAVRVHANFAEYTPLALLLLAFVELGGAPALWVHGLAAVFTLGRVVHAYGVSQAKEKLPLRVFGMVCSFSVLLLAAGTLLWRAL